MVVDAISISIQSNACIDDSEITSPLILVSSREVSLEAGDTAAVHMEPYISVVSVAGRRASIVYPNALARLPTKRYIRGLASRVRYKRHELTIGVVDTKILCFPIVQVSHQKIERGDRRVEFNSRRRPQATDEVNSGIHVACQGRYGGSQVTP